MDSPPSSDDETPPSSDDETPDPAVTGTSEDTGVPAASGVKDISVSPVRNFVSYFFDPLRN